MEIQGGTPLPGSQGDKVVLAIGTMEHKDLGFNPMTRPMSYLLSVGWRDRETKKLEGREVEVNKFNSNEMDALLYEFAGFISRAANDAARYVTDVDENFGGQVKKQRNSL